MIAIALQSGSNGNCIYVESADARLLFDAGISGLAAERRLAKYGRDIRSVQAVVRKGPLFFESPMAAIFEYERDDLLGTMEVTYAPKMRLRTRYYGADEVFEVQGTEGLLWVTRATGEMFDLSPLIWHRSDGTEVMCSNLDADWGTGFRNSSKAFVDALLAGTTPEMTGEQAVEVLQLCFAVYQASTTRTPVDPASIEGSVSPPWWPKTPLELLEDAQGLGLVPEGLDVGSLLPGA